MFIYIDFNQFKLQWLFSGTLYNQYQSEKCAVSLMKVVKCFIVQVPELIVSFKRFIKGKIKAWTLIILACVTHEKFWRETPNIPLYIYVVDEPKIA